jgi:DNA-binding MarR family transcriptional regulator
MVKKNENPALPGPRYEALVQVLRTADILWNASRAYFARWDLSPSQFNVLKLLADFPQGCAQVELSRQLLMHRSNVTGLVDRLEGRGLVQRRADAEDRRAYLVRITSAGEELLESILPHYYRAAEAVWGDLPLGRAERIVADLAYLSGNAERMAESGT